MDVIGAVREIQLLAGRIESSAKACTAAVTTTIWECPRGRRATSRAVELATKAQAIARDLVEISVRLRADLAAARPGTR